MFVKLVDVDTPDDCSVHPTQLWCYNSRRLQVPTRMQGPCPHLARSEQPAKSGHPQYLMHFERAKRPHGKSLMWSTQMILDAVSEPEANIHNISMWLAAGSCSPVERRGDNIEEDLPHSPGDAVALPQAHQH